VIGKNKYASHGFVTRMSSWCELQALCSDAVIPNGSFALHAQATFDLVGRIQTDQVEHDLLQEGEILWRVVFAHGAGILAEADVENPEKQILDAPVGPNCCRELFGGQLVRHDVVAPLQVRLLVTHLTEGVHQTELLALGPIRQIDDAFRGQHRSNWADDSTMGSEQLPVTVNLLRWIMVNELGLDGLQQLQLFLFDSQGEVLLLVGDLIGDVFLAPHGVAADQQPVDIECFQEFWDGGDLITLAGHLFLVENDPGFGCKGADHVNGTPAATARPAHRLAVNSHDACQGTDLPSHPAAERRFEWSRVEGLEDAQKGLLRGNPIPEYQEFVEPRLPSYVPTRRCLRWNRSRRGRRQWQSRESLGSYSASHFSVTGDRQLHPNSMPCWPPLSWSFLVPK
jgi:hypothetical protein